MLQDKVIIVTGGAGLLGQEICRSLVKNGAVAIIADYDIKKAKDFEKELHRDFGEQSAASVELDIRSSVSIESMISGVDDRYKRIDGVINNAYPRNKNYGRDFFEVEYEDFCENTSIHLGGYFQVSQKLAEYFKNQGYGNILNMSSIYGVVAPKFEIYKNTPMTMPVEYAVIKSGLIHLTKYMAKYLKGLSIRVNSVSLGGIFDNQPEPFLEAYRNQCLNKGMLDKQDITGTIVFLLSDQSQYINGQNIVIDDGFTL